MLKNKKWLYILLGLTSGAINGLLGSGGGMILVPALNKCKIETKKSHATSVAIIFAICLVSSMFYLINGDVKIKECTPYLLWGLIGCCLGANWLSKINDSWLHRIFGIIMLWAAYRMIVS